MPCALSPPHYRAHAFFVPLTHSLFNRPAKRERQTERHWQRGREGKREREREGKRWGWLSPVLRDAHQSTQSHGRAIATVFGKGILCDRHSSRFLSSASRNLPLSLLSRAYALRSTVCCSFRSNPRSDPPARARAIRHRGVTGVRSRSIQSCDADNREKAQSRAILRQSRASSKIAAVTTASPRKGPMARGEPRPVLAATWPACGLCARIVGMRWDCS